MEFAKCPTCGFDIVSRTGRPGRPAQYHKDCRKVEQLLSWLDDLLSVKVVTLKKKKEIQGRLFTLANSLNRPENNTDGMNGNQKRLVG